MRHPQSWLALVSVCLAFACTSQREQAPTPQTAPAATSAVAPTAPSEPEVNADYGLVPGHRTFDEKAAPDFYIRDAGYPPGVFAVAMPDRERLLAFDVESNGAAICTRIEQKPFDLPNRINIKYARFQCPDDWTSRKVVFLDATQFEPKYAETLEWKALAGPSPLPMPGGKPAGGLHDYAAVARPGLLDGRWLVSAAWFSGEYPPRKEWDELRGDTIAFGHYQLLDRTLFIGESSLKPSTVLYRAHAPIDVREGIEWALLPQTASEKTQATISALYQIPNGYLVRVSMEHDHEGFGVDESTYFYAWEAGRWRLLAKAEQTRLY
ncbi:MAG TPA: hypothetical protein VM846_15790 [Vicinamibacterales bacterium]|nr:hypothetical protein [Vicinamibacterales bacterium]